MEIKKWWDNNPLWIEITDKQKGFLVFGDLARQERTRGIKISDLNNEVDIICEKCPHKLRFKKKEIIEIVEEDGKRVERIKKVWDWWKWRVLLKGNQISKTDLSYYIKLRVEFRCRHCQWDLPPRDDY